MSKAALSILVFGIYLVLIGVLLALVPNLLLPLAGVKPTAEVWIRLAGMLLIFLGFFYSMSARAEFRPFFRWTLYTRSAGFFFVLAFILSGLAPWVMMLFWLGDLAGAVWTFAALKADAKVDGATIRQKEM